MSSVLYGPVILPSFNQHVKCQSVVNFVLCKILSVTNSKPFVFSKELGCQMNFAVYLPPQAEDGEVPVIYWLSGLTCTEQNFIMKSGVQRYASEHGIIIVAPDTSPSECEFFNDSEATMILLFCYLLVHSCHRSSSHWLHIVESCVYSKHSSHGISGGCSGQFSMVFSQALILLWQLSQYPCCRVLTITCLVQQTH